MEIEKPIVQKCYDKEWEFIYPPSIDNEKTDNEFWSAVDLLDYNDIEAEKSFKKLIKKNPFHIDAYNHLSIAYRNQGKEFESLLTAEKSYNTGTSCLPKSFNFKKDKIVWSNLENRPFLRACLIYGLECQQHKKHIEALEVYSKILTLNEDDNQGIRYLLLETFFTIKNYKEARKILVKYPDDFSIEFKFGLIALDILDDNFKEVEKNLNEAIKTNEFFIDEIIKDKHLKPSPYRIPNEPNYDAGIPIGSIQQAFDYWKRNEQLYKTKKIISYFKDRQKTSQTAKASWGLQSQQ